MSDHTYSHRRSSISAEDVFAQKPEILENIEFFGLDPVLAGQYVCAASLKKQYVRDMRLEEAGRMRDVELVIKEMHTKGQQLVLGVIDISLNQLIP